MAASLVGVEGLGAGGRRLGIGHTEPGQDRPPRGAAVRGCPPAEAVQPGVPSFECGPEALPRGESELGHRRRGGVRRATASGLRPARRPGTSRGRSPERQDRSAPQRGVGGGLLLDQGVVEVEDDGEDPLRRRHGRGTVAAATGPRDGGDVVTAATWAFGIGGGHRTR